VFIVQIASASQKRREKTQFKVISDYGKNTRLLSFSPTLHINILVFLFVKAVM